MSDPASESPWATIQNAVIHTYYPDRVRGGASARHRAQAAHSVVSLFAGAVVAVFTVTSLATAAPLTRASGCLAVGLWLFAAILYVHAIATLVPPLPNAPQSVRDFRSLIEEVLKRADQEAKQVDRRQAAANIASVLALAVTVLTVVLVMFADHPDRTRRGVLLLGPEGQRAMQTLCGQDMSRLDGEIDVLSLASEFISITTASCSDSGEVTIRIPRNSVSATFTRGE